MSKYLIGHITNTHGIRGEVKIYNYSDFNRFFVGAKVYVEMKGIQTYFQIERVREQNNLLIVKFKNYDNINDILMYKGLDIYSDDDISDQLDEDDYHYQSLFDKPCYTKEGLFLGTVLSVVEVPQGHLLEIKTADERKVLVPFIKAFVKDVLNDKIIIEPIEGLI